MTDLQNRIIAFIISMTVTVDGPDNIENFQVTRIAILDL